MLYLKTYRISLYPCFLRFHADVSKCVYSKFSLTSQSVLLKMNYSLISENNNDTSSLLFFSVNSFLWVLTLLSLKKFLVFHT